MADSITSSSRFDSGESLVSWGPLGYVQSIVLKDQDDEEHEFYPYEYGNWERQTTGKLKDLRDAYAANSGLLDGDGNKLPLKIDGFPWDVGPEGLEKFGFVNPFDNDSFDRINKVARADGLQMGAVPAYDEDATYTEAGVWVKHGGSVYVKKSTGNTHDVAPGSANNTHWALWLDSTDGAVGGQDGSSMTRLHGPVYRRTNSSTRPSTPADDSGTVGITTGVSTAPPDWGTAQLQPTATEQYVYISFVYLAGVVWKWLTPFLSAQYQAPPVTSESHVKGDWDATVTYERGDIIVSHGTLCILSSATSLNQNPEANPNVWIRIRNAAVPWRSGSTYAFGEHVSQHGKLYVLKVTSATGIDPSLASQTSWVQIGGPAPEHIEGILTRTETELHGSDEHELDPDVNTLLLAAANVPTATAGRFDDRVRFQSSEINDSESTIKWFTVAELDALTASATYSEDNSLLLYEDGTNGTVRALKVANGNLVIRKTAGTGTTEFEVYVDHIYFTESMDRIQEALRDIVGDTGGSGFKGQWVTGTTYNRGETVLADNALWILYGAATYSGSSRPAAAPLQWFRLGRVQDWASAHTYRAGAIVIGPDDNVYICVRDANTATNPTTNPDQWVMFEPNRPGQAWNATRAYRRGNIVHAGSALYACLAETSTGTDPTGDTQTDWVQMGQDPDGGPILVKTETQIVSGTNYALTPSSDAVLLPGADVPAITAGRYDDRFRIRAGLAGQTLSETWVTIATLRALTGNDGFNTANAIPVHSETTYTFWVRRVGNGNLTIFKYGGTGTTTFAVHIDHHYFTESSDRVEEALREMTGNPAIDTGRLLPSGKGAVGQVLTETSATTTAAPAWRDPFNPLPAVAGQFAVFRRYENNTTAATDLPSGRLQFYSSASAGGAEGTDRQVLGVRWSDVLGDANTGLGLVQQGSLRRFMIVHKTENRGKDLRAFYTGLGQNYWTYPLQFLVFADHDQWVLFSGNLIGNSAAVWENHFNVTIERVLAHNLSYTQRQGAIPFDLQVKWGYQADNDTVPAQKVEHTRFRLGGANQPTLPTLADWDGSAFATGNANQTTEFPPAQDESTSTHLWIFHATSTRPAGPAGDWTTTAWTARRATDPDSTIYSAQYSLTGTGGWTNNKAGIGSTGYVRWRLDSGEWLGPFWYGPLPAPPTIEVEYSATETGAYTSTALTSGWFRWKLSTETTWAGPFRIAEEGTPGVTIPTLDVQYSATEGGTYTSTVLTEGFYRFRYNNGPWIGPAELGATPAPATPAPGTWTQLHSFTVHEGATIAAGHPFSDLSAHEEYRFVVDILDSSSVLQARGYQVIDTDDLVSIVEATSYDSEDGLRVFFDRKFGLSVTTHQKSDVGGASGADQAAFTLFFTRPSTEANARRYTRIRGENRSGATVICRIQVRV